LDSWSVDTVLSGLHGAPAGHTEGLGYIALVWNDFMHQFEEGLEARAAEVIAYDLGEEGKGG